MRREGHPGEKPPGRREASELRQRSRGGRHHAESLTVLVGETLPDIIHTGERVEPTGPRRDLDDIGTSRGAKTADISQEGEPHFHEVPCHSPQHDDAIRRPIPGQLARNISHVRRPDGGYRPPMPDVAEQVELRDTKSHEEPYTGGAFSRPKAPRRF